MQRRYLMKACSHVPSDSSALPILVGTHALGDSASPTLLNLGTGRLQLCSGPSFTQSFAFEWEQGRVLTLKH